MIIVCFFGFISASSPQQTHYFLTKQDFLSGQSVQKQEVRQRSHLQAEYSENDRLLSLIYFDDDHNQIMTDEYQYQDDVLLKKQTFNSQSQLLEETIYGEEENAVRFIEYEMGVDVVKKWGDRYTKTTYNLDTGKPVVHQFYDVDGTQYGNIGFIYNEGGDKTSEIWIREPSKQIVRRWQNIFSNETGLTETQQYDRNGKLIQQFWEDSEGREDILQIIEPLDSSLVQTGNVSYILKNQLKSGNFLWIRKEPSGEDIDTTVFDFTSSISGKGFYTELSTVALRDGAVYELQFEGISELGKTAIPQKVFPIQIDHSSPEVTLSIPPFVFDGTMTFATNEPLAYASVVWTPLIDGITPDPVTIHLTVKEMNRESEDAFLPINAVELSDGTDYAVSMIFSDMIGNNDEIQIDYPVRCDKTNPEIVIHSPYDSLFTPELVLDFDLSERMKSAAVQIIPENGPSIELPLEIDILTAGNHVMMLPYRDSTQYSIRMIGMDLAGNPADTTTLNDINVDYSPPIMEVANFENGSFIRYQEVVYSLSENLESGSILWTEQESKKEFALTGDELQAGDHLFSRYGEYRFQENSPYTLTITGTDFAGNVSNQVVLNDIIYDTTKPSVEMISPATGSSVSLLAVEFLLSETLNTGKISWKNPETDSVYYTYELPDIYLNNQDTLSITLKDTLVSGHSYLVQVSGEDLAGNPSVQTMVPTIFYDTSLPEIAVLSPSSNERANHITIEYILSEAIVSGGVHWIDSINRSIIKSRTFTGDELLEGTHRFEIEDKKGLKDHLPYDMMFFGTDKAKNQCETVIQSLSYDFTPPEIVLIYPESNAFVNHTRILYSLSEPLVNGQISWMYFDKTGNENVIELPLVGLSTGEHKDEPMPRLEDGAEYSISIMGTDSTGNQSVTNTIRRVRYDVTAPEIHFVNLSDSLIFSETEWKWTNSEVLSSGTISFIFSKDDSLTINLDSTQLSLGEVLYFPETNLLEKMEGTPTKIQVNGKDHAGNAAKPSVIDHVILDTTNPVVNILSPISHEKRNHAVVYIQNSEALKTGEVTFTDLDNPSQSVQTIALSADNLLEGIHEIGRNITVNLQDSTFYRVAYAGTDFAGNISEFSTADSIYYDISTPIITVDNLNDGDWIRSSDVEYTISETLNHGEIRWIDETENDSSIIELDNMAKYSGKHHLSETANENLNDGHSYRLMLLCTDPAGNSSNSELISSLRYDITPPVFSEIDLIDSLVVNSIDFGFTLSEDLIQGGVSLIQKSVEVKRFEFNSDKSKAGRHQLSPESDIEYLIDGAVYDIAFFGSDSAGNIADTVSYSGVIYDITPPVVQISHPQTFAYVNTKEAVYTITEDLLEGKMVWTDLTTSEEIMYLLSPEASKSGTHQITDYFVPELIDGRSYSLILTGMDEAGNFAVPAAVQHFIYDISPPIFSHLSFMDNSFINDTEFSYAVSEPLMTGFMEVASAMDEGVILNLLEPGINVPLKDGSAYDISFFGSDSAGNASDTLWVRNIFYDVSPPKLELNSPMDSTLTNRIQIAYMINEPLKQGEIIWTSSVDTIHRNIESQYLTTGKHAFNVDALPIQEKILYSVMLIATDRAENTDTSNVVTSVPYDMTPPVADYLNEYSPVPLNSLELKYTLHEDLANGEILLESKDTTITYALTGEELLNGEHVLTPNINIRDSVVYAPAFIGEDAAGNPLKTNPGILPSMRFDREIPVITVNSPVDSIFTNKINIEYELSETLMDGEITFEYKGGIINRDSLHIVRLGGSRLEKGIRGGVLPPSMVKLHSGGIYDMTFTGTDSAGNTAEPVIIKSLNYDDIIPIMTFIRPGPGTAIADPIIRVEVSEALKDGTIIFRQTGGTVDQYSPWEIPLTGDDLSPGSHELRYRDQIQLADGGIYTIDAAGTDRAGNPSATVKADNILYDTTAPLLQITAPKDGEHVNELILETHISEMLNEGEIVVKSEESTVTLAFEVQERNAGPGLMNLTDRAGLISGEIYTIRLSASDLAGNLSDTVMVKDVRFDTIPPVLSISKPVDNEMISEVNLDYFASETMQSITAVFTETDGNSDLNSPHRIDIPIEGRSEGIHTNITPDMNPGLVESAVYRIELFGLDLAGNSSGNVKVESIIFDSEPPMLNITSPKPDTLINSFTFGFSTSETLRNAVCILERIGGEDDDKSPHRLDISEENLTAGIHNGIQFPEFNLKSGSIYTMKMYGTDFAGNPSDTVAVDSIGFDNIPPEITLDKPKPGDLLIHPEITYGLSETVSSGKAVWSGPGFTYEFDLTPDEMQAGVYENIILANQEPIFLGLPFELTMTAIDYAGNVSRPVAVKDITFTRVIDGEWKYAGILMEVSLVFFGSHDTESRTGTMEMYKKMGSKIDEKIEGDYAIDYTTTPWNMTWDLKNGETKHCIFEFTAINQMRIVIGDKPPGNWNDGELLFFVHLSDNQ